MKTFHFLETTVINNLTWYSQSENFCISVCCCCSATKLCPTLLWPHGLWPTRVLSQSVQSLSCVWLCNPMDCCTPGLPVHHQLLEFTQTHVHWVSDAIQPSHPLLSPSPTFNLSQHQELFQWVSSSHKVAKVLEFQLQHQSFQWTLRTDLL